MNKTKRRPKLFRKDEYDFSQTCGRRSRNSNGLAVWLEWGSHGQLRRPRLSLGIVDACQRGHDTAGSPQVATVNGSKIIGRPEELGTIGARKLADLVIFDRNRARSFTHQNTQLVVKNAKYSKGDTLNQVWPEQKKLEPLWFWNNYDAPKAGEPLEYAKPCKTISPQALIQLQLLDYKSGTVILSFFCLALAFACDSWYRRDATPAEPREVSGWFVVQNLAAEGQIGFESRMSPSRAGSYSHPDYFR